MAMATCAIRSGASRPRAPSSNFDRSTVVIWWASTAESRGRLASPALRSTVVGEGLSHLGEDVSGRTVTLFHLEVALNESCDTTRHGRTPACSEPLRGS